MAKKPGKRRRVLRSIAAIAGATARGIKQAATRGATNKYDVYVSEGDPAAAAKRKAAESGGGGLTRASKPSRSRGAAGRKKTTAPKKSSAKKSTTAPKKSTAPKKTAAKKTAPKKTAAKQPAKKTTAKKAAPKKAAPKAAPQKRAPVDLTKTRTFDEFKADYRDAAKAAKTGDRTAVANAEALRQYGIDNGVLTEKGNPRRSIPGDRVVGADAPQAKKTAAPKAKAKKATAPAKKKAAAPKATKANQAAVDGHAARYADLDAKALDAEQKKIDTTRSRLDRLDPEQREGVAQALDERQAGLDKARATKGAPQKAKATRPKPKEVKTTAPQSDDMKPSNWSNDELDEAYITTHAGVLGAERDRYLADYEAEYKRRGRAVPDMGDTQGKGKMPLSGKKKATANRLKPKQVKTTPPKGDDMDPKTWSNDELDEAYVTTHAGILGAERDRYLADYEAEYKRRGRTVPDMGDTQGKGKIPLSKPQKGKAAANRLKAKAAASDDMDPKTWSNDELDEAYVTTYAGVLGAERDRYLADYTAEYKRRGRALPDMGDDKGKMPLSKPQKKAVANRLKPKKVETTPAPSDDMNPANWSDDELDEAYVTTHAGVLGPERDRYLSDYTAEYKRRGRPVPDMGDGQDNGKIPLTKRPKGTANRLKPKADPDDDMNPANWSDDELDEAYVTTHAGVLGPERDGYLADYEAEYKRRGRDLPDMGDDQGEMPLTKRQKGTASRLKPKEVKTTPAPSDDMNPANWSGDELDEAYVTTYAGVLGPERDRYLADYEAEYKRRGRALPDTGDGQDKGKMTLSKPQTTAAANRLKPQKAKEPKPDAEARAAELEKKRQAIVARREQERRDRQAKEKARRDREAKEAAAALAQRNERNKQAAPTGDDDPYETRDMSDAELQEAFDDTLGVPDADARKENRAYARELERRGLANKPDTTDTTDADADTAAPDATDTGVDPALTNDDAEYRAAARELHANSTTEELEEELQTWADVLSQWGDDPTFDSPREEASYDRAEQNYLTARAALAMRDGDANPFHADTPAPTTLADLPDTIDLPDDVAHVNGLDDGTLHDLEINRDLPGDFRDLVKDELEHRSPWRPGGILEGMLVDSPITHIERAQKKYQPWGGYDRKAIETLMTEAGNKRYKDSALMDTLYEGWLDSTIARQRGMEETNTGPTSNKEFARAEGIENYRNDIELQAAPEEIKLVVSELGYIPNKENFMRILRGEQPKHSDPMVSMKERFGTRKRRTKDELLRDNLKAEGKRVARERKQAGLDTPAAAQDTPDTPAAAQDVDDDDLAYTPETELPPVAPEPPKTNPVTGDPLPTYNTPTPQQQKLLDKYNAELNNPNVEDARERARLRRQLAAEGIDTRTDRDRRFDEAQLAYQPTPAETDPNNPGLYFAPNGAWSAPQTQQVSFSFNREESDADLLHVTDDGEVIHITRVNPNKSNARVKLTGTNVNTGQPWSGKTDEYGKITVRNRFPRHQTPQQHHAAIEAREVYGSAHDNNNDADRRIRALVATQMIDRTPDIDGAPIVTDRDVEDTINRAAAKRKDVGLSAKPPRLGQTEFAYAKGDPNTVYSRQSFRLDGTNDLERAQAEGLYARTPDGTVAPVTDIKRFGYGYRITSTDADGKKHHTKLEMNIHFGMWQNAFTPERYENGQPMTKADYDERNRLLEAASIARARYTDNPLEKAAGDRAASDIETMAEAIRTKNPEPPTPGQKVRQAAAQAANRPTKSEYMARKPADRDAAVYEDALQGEASTTAQIAEATGMTRAQTLKTLNRLEQRGLIARQEQDDAAQGAQNRVSGGRNTNDDLVWVDNFRDGDAANERAALLDDHRNGTTTNTTTTSGTGGGDAEAWANNIADDDVEEQWNILESRRRSDTNARAGVPGTELTTAERDELEARRKALRPRLEANNEANNARYDAAYAKSSSLNRIRQLTNKELFEAREGATREKRRVGRNGGLGYEEANRRGRQLKAEQDRRRREGIVINEGDGAAPPPRSLKPHRTGTAFTADHVDNGERLLINGNIERNGVEMTPDHRIIDKDGQPREQYRNMKALRKEADYQARRRQAPQGTTPAPAASASADDNLIDYSAIGGFNLTTLGDADLQRIIDEGGPQAADARRILDDRARQAAAPTAPESITLEYDANGSVDRKQVLAAFADGVYINPVFGPDRPRVAQSIAAHVRGIMPTKAEVTRAAHGYGGERRINAYRNGREYLLSAYRGYVSPDDLPALDSDDLPEGE